MDKSRTLLIAIGQGASIIVDRMKTKNPRYPVLFINSTIRDLKGLENLNLETNTILYNGTDGTGNNGILGAKYAQENQYILSSKLTKYIGIDTYVVVFTGGGGTGQGGFSKVVEILKKAFPTKKINLVAIAPRFEEGKERIFNFLSCWNNINKLIPYVDDVKIVDNNLRKDDFGRSFDYINESIVNHLDACYSLSGSHGEQSIDNGDSLRVNTAKGFGAIFILPKNYKNAKDAFDVAIKNNPFALPNNNKLRFSISGINLIENGYDIDETIGQFKSKKIPYITYNSKSNIVVLGGGAVPSNFIDSYKEVYEDYLDQEKEESITQTKEYTINFEVDEEIEKSVEPKNTIIYDEDELDSLIFDDSMF